MSENVSVEDLKKNGLKGFDLIESVHGSTYRDCSTVVIVPTRGTPWEPSLPPRFVSALQGLLVPMNQPRSLLFSCGHEVGKAYNETIKLVLNTPGMKFKYVLTVEDDNLPPPDGHVRLLESIHEHHLDAVSGLYFTKSDAARPMAFGDPERFATTGMLEFLPRDVRQAVAERKILPVNGLAMGFTLWRLDLFREIEPPWFVTAQECGPDSGGFTKNFTQDLDFCLKARLKGKRFAVDCRVKVGHLDKETGEVY